MIEASHPSPSGQGSELALDDGERIVERVHEDAPEDIDDQEPRALRAFDHRGAPARRASGVIGWPDQAGLALDKHKRLALVEGVIAERHRIDADGAEFLKNGFGEAKAAGGVLAVDDDEIEPPAGAQKGNLLQDGGAARSPDDVADEEQANHRSLMRMVS